MWPNWITGYYRHVRLPWMSWNQCTPDQPNHVRTCGKRGFQWVSLYSNHSSSIPSQHKHWDHFLSASPSARQYLRDFPPLNCIAWLIVFFEVEQKKHQRNKQKQQHPGASRASSQKKQILQKTSILQTIQSIQTGAPGESGSPVPRHLVASSWGWKTGSSSGGLGGSHRLPQAAAGSCESALVATAAFGVWGLGQKRKGLITKNHRLGCLKCFRYLFLTNHFNIMSPNIPNGVFKRGRMAVWPCFLDLGILGVTARRRENDHFSHGPRHPTDLTAWSVWKDFSQSLWEISATHSPPKWSFLPPPFLLYKEPCSWIFLVSFQAALYAAKKDTDSRSTCHLLRLRVFSPLLQTEEREQWWRQGDLAADWRYWHPLYAAETGNQDDTWWH